MINEDLIGCKGHAKEGTYFIVTFHMTLDSAYKAKENLDLLFNSGTFPIGDYKS